MGLSIKLDEDLPAEIAVLLRDAGHDAVTVVDQGMAGTPDAELWQLIQKENRCLLTADKGFANARDYPPGTHAGIVLLRLSRESRRGYIRLIEALLAEMDLARVAGAITVVSPDAIRIHRGP